MNVDVDQTAPATTYEEACEHAQDLFVDTGGFVAGGTYRVFSTHVAELELRVNPVTGVARPVWDD